MTKRVTVVGKLLLLPVLGALFVSGFGCATSAGGEPEAVPAHPFPVGWLGSRAA